MEGYHEIPLNGAKTYINEFDLTRLCTGNMWKCSFDTLQIVARQRGWDVLRLRYWEEKMLSILLRNATETQATADAEKALKAVRGRPSTTNVQGLEEVHSSALKRRVDKEFKDDADRLAVLLGKRTA